MDSDGASVSLPNNFLDELNCPVCMEMRPLLILPACQHKYCKSCIDKLAGLNGRFQCPACRKETVVPTGGFSVCRLTERLKDELKITQKKEGAGQRCTKCNDKAVEAKCNKCDMFMCYRCVTRTTCAKDDKHDVVDIEDLVKQHEIDFSHWKTAQESKVARTRKELKEKEAKLRDEEFLLSGAKELIGSENCAAGKILLIQQITASKPDALLQYLLDRGASKPVVVSELKSTLASEIIVSPNPSASIPPAPSKPVRSLPSEPDHFVYEQINITKETSGLGFRIVGGVNSPSVFGESGIFVSGVVEGLAAYKDGRLKLYDQIVSVNGVNVEHCSHQEATKAIVSAGQCVRLYVRRRSEPMKVITSVTLSGNGSGDFGFTLCSSSTGTSTFGDGDCVSIASIATGSPADGCGRLTVGDRVLAINGKTVDSMRFVGILMRESSEELLLAIIKTIDPRNPRTEHWGT